MQGALVVAVLAVQPIGAFFFGNFDFLSSGKVEVVFVGRAVVVEGRDCIRGSGRHDDGFRVRVRVRVRGGRGALVCYPVMYT